MKTEQRGYAAQSVALERGEEPGAQGGEGRWRARAAASCAFAPREGLALLYFFDPECSHRYEVAAKMGKWKWAPARVVALAAREPQFATDVPTSAGLKAGVSPDAEQLRKALPFTDPPYAAALRQGRVVATFNSGQMEGTEYSETLKSLGFVEDIASGER